MKLLKTTNRGFTLLEILIYSTIVTLFLTAGLLVTYNIIDYSDRANANRELTENEKFLVQKVFWVLQSNSAINSPLSNATGTSLSVNKLSYSFNPLVISLSGGVVNLVSGATTTPLTNRFVTASNLVFTRRNFSGNDLITVTAVLTGKYTSTTVNTTIAVK